MHPSKIKLGLLKQVLNEHQTQLLKNTIEIPILSILYVLHEESFIHHRIESSMYIYSSRCSVDFYDPSTVTIL